MEELAEKYINDYKNKITKLELPGSKFFLESLESTSEQVESGRSALENILRHDRVERRCARILAEILEDSNEIIVTKLVGSVLSHFGYQNKKGKFLYPEETLYLLETNRLELLKNKKSLSIKEAYELLLNDQVINLKKYCIYKYLVSYGYRLMRKVEFNKIIKRHSSLQIKCDESEQKEAATEETEIEKYVPEDISENIKSKKRRLTEDGHEISKKSKPNPSDLELKNEATHSRLSYEIFGEEESNDGVESLNYPANSSSSSLQQIEGIFERAREAGPRQTKFKDETREPDYCMYLPANNNKYKPDFNLYIRDEEDINLETNSKDLPDIYATCSGESVAFYSLYNITLPNL